MFKVPLIASAIVHATIVAVAVVGGHGPSSSANAISTLELPITVEMIEAQPAPPEVAPLLPVNVERHVTAQAHVHSHTHDYPVPLDHDRPHDPSLVHDHADVSEASEVVALPAPEAAPVFNIVVGPAIAPHGGLTSAHASVATVAATDPVPEAAVNVAARLIASAPPVYPPAARAAEVEADVVLDIILDDTGRVSAANVIRTAGYGLDKSALDAIRGYRFSPAQKDGHPVRVQMHWTVQFRLR